MTKVLLFQDDYKRFEEWVLLYPDRETGGQLFGLWTHEKKPYINIVTGPGKKSRHGTHSFHQDIDYLKKVGRFLNTEFMMCHIGEWHSHHQLRLRQPSSGDLDSIWNHFPEGVERFLLIIATIEEGGVRLNPWLFTASTHSHKAIDVEIIRKNNVFMLDEVVVNNISDGAEISTMNKPKDDTPWKCENERGPQRNEDDKNSGDDTEWYLTDWGSSFVQLLHSKLHNIADSSTEIEKTLEKQLSCLRFTFYRNTCHVVLTFPPDFPKSGLAIVCHVPESTAEPLSWYEFKENGQSREKFVNQIVSNLKRTVPRVDSTTVVKYAGMLKKLV